ncbi:MAG: hypothetical protein ACRD47_06280 [Nitrososphaeraceae archaeon]
MSATKANGQLALVDIFLPALQSTLADARANWFGFVLVNSYIDEYMQWLRGDFRVIPSEVLKRIILLRKRVMGLLNSTVSHKRASGSLSEIYREFYRLFGVNELKDDTLTKIDILEKVYFNLQQLSFLHTDDDSGK